MGCKEAYRGDLTLGCIKGIAIDLDFWLISGRLVMMGECEGCKSVTQHRRFRNSWGEGQTNALAQWWALFSKVPSISQIFAIFPLCCCFSLLEFTLSPQSVENMGFKHCFPPQKSHTSVGLWGYSRGDAAASWITLWEWNYQITHYELRGCKWGDIRDTADNTQVKKSVSHNISMLK